jgi:gustatory receptor
MRYLGRNKAGIYVYHDSKVKLLEGRKLMDCDDASSVVSPSICTDEVSESDRFSFTSSIVQSLDGHLSDTDNNGVEENTKRVKFAQTNL